MCRGLRVHSVPGTDDVCAAAGCGGIDRNSGEYIWDHRNASLREWLVEEHVMGALGMGNENVTGFYFDDYVRFALPRVRLCACACA